MLDSQHEWIAQTQFRDTSWLIACREPSGSRAAIVDVELRGCIAAFICVENDVLLPDVGWNPTSRVTVRPEDMLTIGTDSDHDYCEGGGQPWQPLKQRVSESTRSGGDQGLGGQEK